MRIAPLFALLLLAACAPLTSPPSSPSPDVPNTSSCSAAGGTIRPVCRTQRPACVVAYKDAGTTCSDSSQCDGRCRGDYAAPPPPDDGPYVGHCEHDSDPCGCSAEVVGGELQSTRCVD